MITKILLTLALWLDLCAVWWLHAEVGKVIRKYKKVQNTKSNFVVI